MPLDLEDKERLDELRARRREREEGLHFSVFAPTVAEILHEIPDFVGMVDAELERVADERGVAKPTLTEDEILARGTAVGKGMAVLRGCNQFWMLVGLTSRAIMDDVLAKRDADEPFSG